MLKQRAHIDPEVSALGTNVCKEVEVVYKGDDKYHLIYITKWNDEDKPRKKNKGYFFFSNGDIYFQFAGTSYSQSGSKKYDATCKKIDKIDNTWIATNSDRKGRRVQMKEPYISALRCVVELAFTVNVEKIIGE